ncbi:hypothetical protein DFA_02054 [Cavenderia fasciculata]|uniref:Uncharacterized protein n=1 Tax=Cavenderia fasciculata TaxID=261658 RepID=F4PYK2_CACFS|nr:uncharacterized protein DFA_02054 [Cavenderia fasciculata]EGG19268.1 hypothetical protein DFA_02054 [Cavenderia fasciculata]|eukprot:XP_004357539.1 hypothetical protein DFA_02054 [Cavenderia fasciculata]
MYKTFIFRDYGMGHTNLPHGKYEYQYIIS